MASSGDTSDYSPELLKIIEAEVPRMYEVAKENIKLLTEDPEAYAEKLQKNLDTQLRDPTNFIGGGAGTIKGILSKTWNEAAATKAVDKMIAGEHAANIWRETGTYHNPIDKKLRQEISDLPATLKKTPNDKEVEMMKLSDLLDHPELYASYPQLKNLDVVTNPGQRGGTLHHATRYSDPLLEVGTAQDVRSVLLHEVQHAIQKIEGFARGANIEAATEFLKRQTPKLESAQKLAETKAAELSPSVLAKINDSISRLKEIVGIGTPMDAYKRAAGEVESRIVQARKDFTDEERRLMAPFQEMDVPWSQQIADIQK